ncbi:MAG TPA: double-CXXCG motif protein [Archangium sp.]|nr:double-CXXCG motif protein [Archangium sp.]
MASETSASPRFFALTEGAHGSRYDVDVEKAEPINRGDAPRCPQCGSAIGLLKWLPPYRVELKLYGEELGDFIKNSAYDLLISERVAEAFRAERLTGLEGFHPVEVLRARSKKKRAGKSLTVPRYSVVFPCYGRGAVDLVLNRVRIRKTPTCTECRSAGVDAINGFVLEPGTWGGEDIFRPRGLPGDIVVSERFKDFVERHGWTNMVLTPIEQFVWDPGKLGPAPLPTA